jgi:hypothetical protein
VNPSQEPSSPAETYADGPASGGSASDEAAVDELNGPWELPYAVRQPRRRPWRRTVVVSILTFLAVVAAGVPLGLLWSWLTPSVPVVATAQGQVVVNDPSPEEFIAADGWFTLLGFGFGVLVAVAAWLIVRRHRGPWLLLSVVLGALGAAGAAWQVGRQIGLADYERWRGAVTAGATFSRPPDLHAHGALLVPAFAAVIVCTLLAGWANDPDLDTPGAQPGYGHNVPAAPYEDYPFSPGPVSSGSPDAPDPTTAPAPPAPGPGAPPRG